MEKQNIKPQTLTSLANSYGVCVATMKKWLQELNIAKKGRIFTIKQVKEIYNEIGSPDEK
jgi:hypothetical protein